ncbi:MAG TPA: UTP--glucose-1-phosphate uridylyltransferase [Pirellulaceae bacterium]|nr:UTP--glucose-1-phosphate uridylyltransferase [Pirellulaceae bacterium]
MNHTSPQTIVAPRLVELILSSDDALRNQALERVCANATTAWLLEQCDELDALRRSSTNLYERVRALQFLAAMHRYHLPALLPSGMVGQIPFDGYQHLLKRRFGEAIERFLQHQRSVGPSDAISSALAQAYRGLSFQTLADQVRKSVRTVRGNQWMFRIGNPADQPLRLRRELLERRDSSAPFPILVERTPVRMDFSHSAWSDIFFLGMDYPAAARVMNVSIDLGVHGRDAEPKPPIECYLRVIDRPILRLVSLDLEAAAEITHVDEVFDFARDYLGLLKAAVIAAGIVPPAMEGSEQRITSLLEPMLGAGLGLEIVSNVHDIPKGSRLAVSTNLLGSLISLGMRATGQIPQLTGDLTESDRRLVAARAILGEWIGGSGGGWQDSGGIWPGIKIITGVEATPDDPEYGQSHGRLLPQHRILNQDDVSPATRAKLQDSLILVHGGMAQNVGPILEMVTEKYLLRSEAEWQARHAALRVLDDVCAALHCGDLRAVGRATTDNFFGPLQTIVPWCTNQYTESLIQQMRQQYGEQFWGFWMLGGMAGGGMGFIVDPAIKTVAQHWLQEAMTSTKQRMQHSLPFAMEPVVYDFAINDRGTWSELLSGEQAAMPGRYYAQTVPAWVRSDLRNLSPQMRTELARFGAACRESPQASANLQALFARLLPQVTVASEQGPSLSALLELQGFDHEAHEQIRADLRAGRIGLAQNRLPSNLLIEDATPDDVCDLRRGGDARHIQLGNDAIASGAVAVVTLAAGVGSRWTQGAGVVKALHPFCKLAGRHRTFLEVHLAKSRRVAECLHAAIPHLVTTSYLTHRPIEQHLQHEEHYGDRERLWLSPGRAIGLRMIPMVRDLQFAWNEMPQQLLDEQQEKMRASVRSALLTWAKQQGEGDDYTDNLPEQCLHPVGHWYEVSNLLRNGVLEQLLRSQPTLRYLMLHNIDTLGVDVDPGVLGLHIERGHGLSFEVIGRRLEDRGGGLARVNGKLRLVEGLAMPRDEDEFRLSYYNSLTTWIDIDQLLAAFRLTRADLNQPAIVESAVRNLGRRIPTYCTLKDVKKRWGQGQEDVFPVSQFEKLWGDMTALPELDCGYFLVPFFRGQQLKDQAQLDGWRRDGSAEYVTERCHWQR